MSDRSTHRSINELWVIEGTLVLETPAHFGNGDADALIDMPLLFDEATGKPLLPGTSIAGALRNYLRELTLGYSKPFPKPNEDKTRERNLLATKLFGGFRSDDEGEQSPLIINDAIGAAQGIELRDGVKIDAVTRTAEDEKKFDMQLLAAGSTFPLHFELLLSETTDEKKQELCQALAVALNGLTTGEITLGARKRRGFGQCKVNAWKVWQYDLKDRDQLLKWLASDYSVENGKDPVRWADAPFVKAKEGSSIADLLDVTTLLSDDARKAETAHLTASFTIDGTLLIRSGFGTSDEGPDTVHLHSRHKDKGKVPVIPGTSWAGVLRHRALKIARTVSKDREIEIDGGPVKTAQCFVDDMFGMFGEDISDNNKKKTKASRVTIKESEIVDSKALVMTRVKIDRFTGGAYEGALFSEQPVIGQPLRKSEEQPSPQTCVTLDLTLRKPQAEKGRDPEKVFQAEIGLLLLLLKDLWTGDLPIGGESGVGRGRLKGIYAKLQTNDKEWEFHAKGEDGVVVSPESKTLQETFVDAFNTKMKGQSAA